MVTTFEVVATIKERLKNKISNGHSERLYTVCVGFGDAPGERAKPFFFQLAVPFGQNPNFF
jgi:hypothetical protein